MSLSSAGAGSAQAVVLYDQTTPAGTTYLDSNAFVPSGNPSESEIADDFVVPAGETWTIEEVDVGGQFVGAPPATVNVRLYSDSGGPSTQLFQQLAIGAASGPNYTIPLTGAPALSSGTYWVSVQQAGATLGQLTNLWRWQTIVSGTNYNGEAQVRFPNDEVCMTFMPIGPCFDTSARDMVFRLQGSLPAPAAAGAAAAAACPPFASAASNFHPKFPKLPTVPGVRAKITVSQPAQLEIDATLKWKKNGDPRTTDLGKHSLTNPGRRKLRIPLPDSIVDDLPIGSKVKLLLHITGRPTSPGCTGSIAEDKRVKTRVVHVRANA